MTQKGQQQQQHEWIMDNNFPLSDIQYFHCAKCPCIKRVERGDPLFFPDRNHFVYAEPTCVKTYPEQEDSKNE